MYTKPASEYQSRSLNSSVYDITHDLSTAIALNGVSKCPEMNQDQNSQKITVSCEKLEPLSFLDYPANMFSTKTMLHIRLSKVLVFYAEYSVSYSRKTGGPIFRKQL